MTLAKYLSDVWTAIAPAVGNHLWQSTLFAVAAGLLTLLLRKNQARARYWLWLAASVKFLVPFSLLVGIGNHLGWTPSSDGIETGFTFAMDQFSQPFSQPAAATISHAAASTTPTLFTNVMHFVPVFLPAVWLCGFFAVICVWAMRWRQMSAAIREATPLREGREVKALRRLEFAGGIRKRIEILLSRASLEPGIFGIARPVLVWPEGISARLEDTHMEAILAHEVGHVRRRDNLFAAIHMLVQAIFWFHPLVWFLGTRLVEEREVACDEEVLELGSERQVYAESILKICEFCVGSPLACVSGVTGADLKRRIVRIMTRSAARKLDFSKKLLLSAACLLAIVVPVVYGVAHTSSKRNQAQTQDTGAVLDNFKFEVASIKPVKFDMDVLGRIGVTNTPDGFRATSAPLKVLIQQAYGVESYQISGAPDWLNSELYDIEAKMDAGVADALQKLGPDDRNLARQRMLQALLVDRFKLTIRRETKELQIYALVIAKNGPNLKEEKQHDAGSNNSSGTAPSRTGTVSGGGPGGPLIGKGVPIAGLARLLTYALHRPVLDQTGLTGKYDFTLQWTPDNSQLQPSTGIQEPPAPPDPNGRPPLLIAIQEQLGLKLESKKGPVEMIVVEHVEKPSGN